MPWAAPGDIGATTPAAGTISSLQSNSTLRVKDSGSANYAEIQAPALGGNYTLTLPADDGNLGQILRTDGSGNLSWISPGGGGDMMTGTYDDNTNSKVDLA